PLSVAVRRASCSTGRSSAAAGCRRRRIHAADAAAAAAAAAADQLLPPADGEPAAADAASARPAALLRIIAMAKGVACWDRTTPLNNGTVDSNVGMAENMAPADVNNGVRGLMTSVAQWRDDLA